MPIQAFSVWPSLIVGKWSKSAGWKPGWGVAILLGGNPTRRQSYKVAILLGGNHGLDFTKLRGGSLGAEKQQQENTKTKIGSVFVSLFVFASLISYMSIRISITLKHLKLELFMYQDVNFSCTWMLTSMYLGINWRTSHISEAVWVDDWVWKGRQWLKEDLYKSWQHGRL